LNQVDCDGAHRIGLIYVKNIAVLDSITAKTPGVIIAQYLRHVSTDRLLMRSQKLLNVEPVDTLTTPLSKPAAIGAQPSQDGPICYAIKN
jgi:hypothetical protein